tara:strand:- start:301 stop:477 length:177 start_codon:yes stop_codon:yes gene_type:complete
VRCPDAFADLLAAEFFIRYHNRVGFDMTSLRGVSWLILTMRIMRAMQRIRDDGQILLA